jgi:hypothetical protein
MRKKFLIKPFLQIRQLLWTLSIAVMCFVIGYLIFESVLAKHLTHDAITAQNWPALQHQLRLGFLLGLAILLCLIGIESYFFFHSIAGPIYALERGLRRIAQGDFNDVTRIREKIDNMGPINPMAMEAYNEIKERNDFIITQKDDLLKAKESLFNTITEIEGVASQTFMDAFTKIKEHFITVFRSLFNEGDDCDLKLVDPTRPLESEIDIIAKPKGKRPLTINALSGGEKTLTATALLFSMYLLKPAPFCIFDEVDAPLDDANIDKFNNIIRSFSKDSQFIIVTHNKRTMTTTDVIYGVTMVEKGISRVVPVDMRELA